MAPELVEGLQEAMDKGVVCSNYTNPKHTWETLQKFKGGTALFTQPATPIKCGGAPQKIMYLADEHFRKTGVRNKTDIVFALRQWLSFTYCCVNFYGKWRKKGNGCKRRF